MATDTFNSGSGNWTVPTGVTSVLIQIWGAGGGGGPGDQGPSEAGGGGGGGGYCERTETVTPGNNVAYSVGSGGAGRAADSGINGGNGGASTCSTFSMTANGGNGGQPGPGNGGSGGTATGGTTNTTGSTGSNHSGSTGGAGGAAANTAGGGGTGGAAQTNGNAAGGGGGGGNRRGSTSGTGAAGRVQFTYTIAGNTYNETMSGGANVNGSAKEANYVYVTIYPNGDGSKGAGWENESAGTTNLYQSIDEGFNPASDSDYVVCDEENSYIFFLLDNMPANFGTANEVRIILRTNSGTKGDYLHWSAAQIIAANEVDAITSSFSMTDGVATITTYDYAPSINLTNKSAWDGARLKLTTGSGTSNDVKLTAAAIVIAYTATNNNTYNEYPTGGVNVAGDGNISEIEPTFIASGGASCAGSAIIEKVSNISTSGGAILLGSYSQNSLMSGLVAHWKLNETSGNRVDSYSNNDLTPTNTPGFDTGIIGNGVSFVSASNQVLSVSDNKQINLGGTDFSISLWVKYNALTNNSAQDYLGILSKGSGGAAYCISMQYRIASGFMQAQLNNGVTTGNFAASTFGAFTTGVWYNVIFTYNNTSKAVTISVNGTENGYTSATTPTDVSYALNIGRAYNSNTYNSSAIIDSVSIWKKVLNSAEKSRLYNSGSGIDYQFDTLSFSDTGTGGVSASGSAESGKVYTEVVSGGLSASGSADQQMIFNVDFIGGASGSGTADQTVDLQEIASGGASVAGDGDISEIEPTFIASGGLSASGSADYGKFYEETMSGGLSASGSADYGLILNDETSGGIETSGEAYVLLSYIIEISGGASLNSSALIQFTGSISSQGGISANGSGLYGVIMTEVASGGVEASGISTAGYIYEEIPTGGISAAGELIHRMRFGPSSSGGAKLNGVRSNYNITDGMIAHWKLDEITGNRLDSFGKNNLISVNFPGYTSSGKFGNAVAFVSEAHQAIGTGSTEALITGDVDFTISLWVKFTSLTNEQGTTWIGVISKGSDGQKYCWAIYLRHNGYLEFTIADDLPPIIGTYNGNIVMSSVPVVANEWYHIVAYHDAINDRMGIRVNGTLNDRSTTLSPTDKQSYPLNIGRGWNMDKYNMSGYVDSVSFWERKLSVEEQLKLYNNGSGINFQYDQQEFSPPVSGGARLGGSAMPAGKSYSHVATGGLQASGEAYNFQVVSLYNDLEAFWELDETSGTRFDSIGLNNLTQVNSVSFGTGIIDNSSKFESINNQYLTIADNSDLSAGGTSFEIAGWAKLTAKSNNLGSDYLGLVFKGITASGGDYEYSIHYRASLDRFQFSVGNDTSTDTISADSFGSPSINTWYFICASYEFPSNKLRIAINLVEDFKTTAILPFNSTGPFQLGRTFNSSTYSHEGYIDNLGFWRRKLTDAEEAKLYNGGYGLAPAFQTNTFNEIASGGISAGGSGYNTITPGFVYVGGSADISLVTFETFDGGIDVDGLSDNNTLFIIYPEGGVELDGSIDEVFFYTESEISGGIETSGAASFNKEIYSIEVSGGLSAGGQADSSYTFIPTGGASLDGSADVSLFLSMDGGVSASGSSVVNVSYNESFTEGVAVSGSAIVTFNDIIDDIVSGAEIGGSADIYLNQIPTISGGANVNSSADINVIVNIDTLGGLTANGTAIVLRSFNETGSGGANVAGTALIVKSFNETGSGGANVAGTATNNHIVANPAIGGISCSGTADNTIIIAPIISSGGVKISGNARFSKFRPRLTVRLGYGRSMNNDNILKKSPQKNQLISRFEPDIPELSVDVYKYPQDNGWCEFGENCKYAYLPDVVIERQREHLPLKKFEDTPDSQIATLS